MRSTITTGPSILETALLSLYSGTPRLWLEHAPSKHLQQAPNRICNPRSPLPNPDQHHHPQNPLDRPRPRRPHRPPPPNLSVPTPKPFLRSPNRHRAHARPMGLIRQTGLQHSLLPLALPRHGPSASADRSHGRRRLLPHDPRAR